MWQKCPVCEGRGHVDVGFYADLRSEEIVVPRTGPQVARCRSCDGKGVLQEAHALPTLTRDPMLVPYGPLAPFMLPTDKPWTGDEVPFPYKTTTCPECGCMKGGTVNHFSGCSKERGMESVA